MTRRIIGITGICVLLIASSLFAEKNPAKPDFANDVTLRQVAIEALVVEINEDIEHNYGVEYTLESDEGENPSNVLDALDVRFPPELRPVSVPLFKRSTGGSQIGHINRLPGLGFNFVGMDANPGTVSGNIRLLMSEGKAKIRTHPIVVAVHGTKASIETVEEVPFQDISFTNKGEAYLDVKYEKVGVKLNVIPRVIDIPKRIVELDISDVNVSSVSSYVTLHQITRPLFAESTAKTRVQMKSGETLIIGGLKTEREVVRENRVPILGDIPLLGWLFKNHKKILEVTDTLFFITPHILEPDQSPILPFDFTHWTPLVLKEEIIEP